MRGLFAVEAACWDLHGFNRLGGNSLAETVVAGRVIGARARADRGHEPLGLDGRRSGLPRGHGQADRLWRDRPSTGGSIYAVRDRVAEILNEKVGVFRTGGELEVAVAELEAAHRGIARTGLRSSDRASIPS